MSRNAHKTHFFSIFIKLGWASVLLLALSACASPKFTYGTYVNGDGSIELNLRADGTFAVHNYGTILDQGTFSIHGSQFTWETSSACDPRGKAAYNWTYQNATLVLKVSGTDPCTHRQAGIDRLEYRLKP
jgi:hypothetical protein